MEKLELRFSDAKMESTDEGLKVSGYVNRTGQWSQELGTRKKFVERIMPGAFQKALQSGNEVHFLAEHDNAKILSSTRNDSLTLREDEHGLYMEAVIAPTSWGRDYHTLIKEGIIRNMSFGMKVLADKWEKRVDGMYERSINDIYLAEVSAVRSPAYVQSTIAARSIEIVEDVEIPAELDEEKESEDRKESNQMELEMRDKLAEVLEKILVTLETQKTESQVESASEPKKVIAETVKIEEKEKVKTEEVKAEKKVEEVEKPKEKVEEVEAVKVDEQLKVEPTKELVKESVSLTDYYKRVLDF